MRKFIFSLLFSLLSTVAFAQTDSMVFIDNFSDGMKPHISEYLLDNGEAEQAINVRINNKYGDLAKRPKRLLLAKCHSYPVKSLYRYYLSDANKYTIATSSTYLDAIDSNGSCVTLFDLASDSKRWSFVTFKDMLIGINGTNNAKKWDGKTQVTSADGSRTTNNLTADLGAPFAELNTGTNLSASKWYQYKIAYYDVDSGIYTYSSARSNPILTLDTDIYNITLTDIPLGQSGVDMRIIYRTVGDASRTAVLADNSFYKVAIINDNSTQTYNDTMTDATLTGDAAPTWSTVTGSGYDVTPPKAKYAVINGDRLFLANDPSGTDSGKSIIYYSPVLKQDYFYYHTDYELIRPDDGDEITFIKNLLGILTVGKTRTISKFYTEGSTTNWSISNPFSFMGCVAPYSAVNGINGIIYLGRYGLYNFNGQSSELISDVVTNKIRDILETNQDEVFGIYHDNSYYMAYTSIESGAANNDRVLLLDVTRNAYVEDHINVDSFANYDSGDDSGTLYSGSSDVDGAIYAHSIGVNRLIYRYKSQIDEGIYTDTYVGGTENSPTITLGTNQTWAELGVGTWADSGSWTWLLHAQTGYWYSPIVQINADTLDKLQWNESLGTSGDITFAVRTGATSGAVSAAAWSSEFTDPSGSDVSAITGNVFIQLRAKLTTTSWTETPTLYLSDYFVIKLSYKKSGNVSEPSFLSFWQGGINTLGSDNPKRLKEIQVFYSGTQGTLGVSYTDEGGTSRTFDVDMSISPSLSNTDQYYGTDDNKIYVYIPSYTDQPSSRSFQFSISETGTEDWHTKRIGIRFETLPYTVRQGRI